MQKNPTNNVSENKAPKKPEYHGLSNTCEYVTWTSMIQRCHNPNNLAFSYYGGRGIKVCDRWRNSFEAFLRDMGPRPSKQHTIDRYPDKNGNYEPENARWATRKEQADNRREYANAVRITSGDETHFIAEWSQILGVSYQVLYHRWLRSPNEDIHILATRPPKSAGEHHVSARFTMTQVREMRRLHFEDGLNCAAVGRQFGIDRRHARSIIIGTFYKEKAV